MEDKVQLKLIELERALKLAENELLYGENLTRTDEANARIEISNVKYAILTLNNL